MGRKRSTVQSRGEDRIVSVRDRVAESQCLGGLLESDGTIR